MEQTDEQNMLEFQAGSNQAIQTLFERYKKPVFNFCLRILSNRADAEDATADVFLSLFKRQYQYNEGAKFATWLYTIARNGCIDKIRKRQQSVSLQYQAENGESKEWVVEDRAEGIKEAMINKENETLIQKAIAKLGLEERQAIVLREYQKCSYQEIADVLGCSLEKVKILIYRSRERLKGELASIINEGGENE